MSKHNSNGLYDYLWINDWVEVDCGIGDNWAYKKAFYKSKQMWVTNKQIVTISICDRGRYLQLKDGWDCVYADIDLRQFAGVECSEIVDNLLRKGGVK